MEVSISAKQIVPSATLAINELITALREQGEHIYHMGFGESPFPVHALIRKALCENSWRQKYLPTQGIIELREEICRFYQKMFDMPCSPSQIVVGPGSKPLMFAALTALDGPIFLPAPSWVSYQHMGHFLSREVHHIVTNSANCYRLEPESLENSLREHAPDRKQQKVLVLNYPCNPTGHTFSAQQLREITDIAREHNVVVLSDEIYALTHFRDQEHHSIAKFYPEGTLSTSGLWAAIVWELYYSLQMRKSFSDVYLRSGVRSGPVFQHRSNMQESRHTGQILNLLTICETALSSMNWSQDMSISEFTTWASRVRIHKERSICFLTGIVNEMSLRKRGSLHLMNWRTTFSKTGSCQVYPGPSLECLQLTFH
jgi:histidinol-phosphate/aromatic aminotransferase/cobyric acid decarboxylase-like protein